MGKYEEMSDFEINKLVAGHLHGEEWWHKYSKVLIMRLMPTDSDGMALRKAPVDYCHNPSDAWPIIFENEITICPDIYTGGWYGQKDIDRGMDGDSIHATKDKNPLRAAMICFLKMKDAEK